MNYQKSVEEGKVVTGLLKTLFASDRKPTLTSLRSGIYWLM